MTNIMYIHFWSYFYKVWVCLSLWGMLYQSILMCLTYEQYKCIFVLELKRVFLDYRSGLMKPHITETQRKLFRLFLTRAWTNLNHPLNGWPPNNITLKVGLDLWILGVWGGTEGWLVLSQLDIVRTSREEGISIEKKKFLHKIRVQGSL